MIRYSNKSDLNDIIHLWNEAFGDSEEDIMFFINNKYILENTLIYEADGKIASMLFLLEGEMKINNNRYPSYYLYAACTLNEYRGKGFMSLLLDFAKKTAYNRGYYYICLLPASKSLYRYYEKYGYKPLFKKKIINISPEYAVYNSDFADTDCENLFLLRDKAFKNIDMFVWDKKSLEFAFEHHKYYGGQAKTNCKGYMLYTQNNSDVTVKEYCFADVSGDFFSEFKDMKNITINLPVEYSAECDNSEIVDSGMILAINDEAEKLTEIVKNPYLGLTLD
ncbi:MAG: GNAT family N-acetyltransferase [Acutalibacteraceae bacterium]|nr:GNAT family N-acetyltransferase [Acutalibacteraceae bacterium]